VITAKCPCGAKLKAPEHSFGKHGKCPRCGTSFPVAPWLFCPECRADVSVDADGRATCNCQMRRFRRGSFVGPAGSTWTNRTQRVRYQLCARFHEDCGPCFRASSHIGAWWGIPVVLGCNCTQHAIRPGETSLPFTDVDAELAKTTPEQRDLIFGRNNRLVLDAGLVSWTDLIGRSVVDFDNVVYKKRLSLESILAAGVREEEARSSWERVSLRRPQR